VFADFYLMSIKNTAFGTMPGIIGYRAADDVATGPNQPAGSRCCNSQFFADLELDPHWKKIEQGREADIRILRNNPLDALEE
jgi:hypothetical protein